MKKYIYIEVHDILFASFATNLHYWLSLLNKFKTYAKEDVISQWTLELVQQLENTCNKITHALDNWIEPILGGFVTEFTIDQFVSCSDTEQRFFKGPRGNFMLSLNFWIKMLLCEQGTMCSHIE